MPTVGESGDPPKEVVRRHCKNNIPKSVLVERTQAVIDSFHNVEDSDGLPPFLESTWELQKSHMSSSRLSDPEEGLSFRVVRHEQLKHHSSPLAKLPVYQEVRSSSQLEGFYFHQNKFITGDR